MVSLTQLRVLAAVSRHGSVTAAAEELHYSQPSVSHHLRRLEVAVGARLLQRVGRGVRLTPEGVLLARRAEEIVGRVDAATDRARGPGGPARRPGPARRLPDRPQHARPESGRRPESTTSRRRAEPHRHPPTGGHGHAARRTCGRRDHLPPPRHPSRGRGLPPHPSDRRPSVPAQSPSRPAVGGPPRLRLDRRMRALPRDPGRCVRTGRLHPPDRLHQRRPCRRPVPRRRWYRCRDAAGACPAGTSPIRQSMPPCSRARRARSSSPPTASHQTRRPRPPWSRSSRRWPKPCPVWALATPGRHRTSATVRCDESGGG